MTILSMVLSGMACVAVVWILLIWRGYTHAWLPDELKGASVFKVERNIITDRPYPVVGRPDQVFRLDNGDLVPVENKNRDDYRVYDTDIAQLSLQAWLLRKTGESTSSFGFVAINSRRTGRRRSIRVDLYPDSVCLRIIERYLDLEAGQVKPRKSKGGKCKSCGHRPKCYAN